MVLAQKLVSRALGLGVTLRGPAMAQGLGLPAQAWVLPVTQLEGAAALRSPQELQGPGPLPAQLPLPSVFLGTRPPGGWAWPREAPRSAGMWLLSGWVPPSSSGRGWDAGPTAQSEDLAEPEVGVQPPWFLGHDPSSPCCQPGSLGVRWENHKAWSWGILRPGDPSPAWGWLVPGFAEQDLTQLLGRCWEPGVWGAEGPLCRSELQTCASCPSAHQPRPVPVTLVLPPGRPGHPGIAGTRGRRDGRREAVHLVCTRRLQPRLR